MSQPHATEETIDLELAYLAILLAHRPAIAPTVLGGLGELGQEGRAELPRRSLGLDGAPRGPKRYLVSRVATAAALVIGSPTLGLISPAEAYEGPATAVPVRQARMVLLVLDSVSQQPLAGVRIRSMAEDLVAVTDGTGRARISSRFADEPVVSLEREGFQLMLLEGTMLSGTAVMPRTPRRAPAVSVADVVQVPAANQPAAIQADQVLQTIRLPEQPKMAARATMLRTVAKLRTRAAVAKALTVPAVIRTQSSPRVELALAAAPAPVVASHAIVRIVLPSRPRRSRARFMPATPPMAAVEAAPTLRPVSASEPGSQRTYTVLPGDSLSKIAKAQLGDYRKWRQLYAANRKSLPNSLLIYPGQRLVLPDASVAHQPGKGSGRSAG